MIKIPYVSLDWWYGFENSDDVRLNSNIFSDISAQAYRALAYFVYLKYIQLSFIQVMYIPSERTIFDYDSEIRTPTNRFKIQYFIGDTLSYLQNKILS